MDKLYSQREVPVVDKLDRRVRVIPLVRLRARGDEDRVVLTPNRKKRWLVLAEILLELGIQLYVVLVVHQQPELDLGVARTRHKVVVEMIRLGGDRRRVGRSVLVLNAR